MRTDLFDFDLPQDRIALRPKNPRDAARLLAVRPGANPETEDRTVRDLPDLLRPGDQLVVNDTKVIPAALHGRRLGRATEPRIEATLIKRLDGSRWRALVPVPRCTTCWRTDVAMRAICEGMTRSPSGRARTIVL